MPECFEDAHCKRGYLCDSESNECVNESPLRTYPTYSGRMPSLLRCPPGRGKIQLGSQTVCRNMCHFGTSVIPASKWGIHQFCEEVDTQTSSSNFTQSYCETARCDLNGQVYTCLVVGTSYLFILHDCLYSCNF